MTDPTLELVETVARAMYEAEALCDEGAWSTRNAVVRDVYRLVAVAALDAMPQPIGYAVAVHQKAPTWTIGGDVHRSPSEAERSAARARGGSFPYATVVALVPVEDQ